MASLKMQEWEEPDALILLEGWARDGLILKDIAYNIGISENTLTSWRKKSPKISAALKKGKEVVDRIVENALYKRAIGYDYDEVTTVCDTNKDGEVVHTTAKTVTKHVPGDTTAQIFWLQNRKPKDWRDKRTLQAMNEVEDMSEIEGEIFNDDSSAEKKDS